MKKSKLLLPMFIACTILLAGTSGYAATVLKKIEVELNSLIVKVNSATLPTDNIVYKGNVYIRADKVSDTLGKSFIWDKKTNVVTITDKIAAKASPLSASDYVNKLKADDGLPIGTIVTYTSSSDPNKLLGRPGQYISKTNFADTTLEQPTNEIIGGTVEVFDNNKDAQNRKKYIDNIGEGSPMFVEYNYINGNALLRLNKSLTPEQAAKYSAKFIKIK